MAVTADTAPLGRRDRKRKATRDALVEAALDLFEQKGYAATTIDDITERADVARRTFFRHFPVKEAVLYPDPDDYEHLLLRSLEEHTPQRLTLGALMQLFATAGEFGEDDIETRRRRFAIISDNHLEVGAGAWDAFSSLRDSLVQQLGALYEVPPDDEQLALGVTLGLFIAAESFARWSSSAPGADYADMMLRTFGDVRALADGSTALGSLASPVPAARDSD